MEERKKKAYLIVYVHKYIHTIHPLPKTKKPKNQKTKKKKKNFSSTLQYMYESLNNKT